MVPSHGATQNDSAQDPWVYPGWDKGEDYATQPAVTDRVIPSRENHPERESSTTGTSHNVCYVCCITSVPQMASPGKILHELGERSNYRSLKIMTQTVE